jgi:hypothetical protein
VCHMGIPGVVSFVNDAALVESHHQTYIRGALALEQLEEVPEEQWAGHWNCRHHLARW